MFLLMTWVTWHGEYSTINLCYKSVSAFSELTEKKIIRGIIFLKEKAQKHTPTPSYRRQL